jgi:hypothetical protein
MSDTDKPAVTGFGAAFRANPVAVALIGAGALWLVAENTGLLGEKKTDGATGGNGWAGKASEAAQGAWSTLRDGSDAVLERAGRYLEDAEAAGGRVKRAGAGLIERIEGDPLTAGLIGLACGAVAALLLPATRGERELIADARDSLWEKGEQLGRQAADCLRSMADRAPPSGPGEFGAHD